MFKVVVVATGAVGIESDHSEDAKCRQTRRKEEGCFTAQSRCHWGNVFLDVTTYCRNMSVETVHVNVCRHLARGWASITC